MSDYCACVVSALPTLKKVMSGYKEQTFNTSEHVTSKLRHDEPFKDDIPGSVMDGVSVGPESISRYAVYRKRWLILFLFVMFSASNASQWSQYTIIQDIITRYYGVKSNLVSWTSMIYMITYIPLIFPASWLLDKTVSLL